jgi:hypothetical protein
MRNRIVLVLLALCFCFIACAEGDEFALKDGDILFQDFPSPQSAAVKIATNSEYSHCGIVFYDGELPLVWEAVQPVTITSLDQWIGRDADSHYVVKRLKKSESILVDSIIAKMKTYASSHITKDYDIYFGWSDDRLYCSEYVWKIYKEILDIELGGLREFKDYNLDHPAVVEKLKERYGENVPTDEPVIAPQDIFDSDKLETVFSQ